MSYYPSAHSIQPSHMPMQGPPMMPYGGVPQPMSTMAPVQMPVYGNMVHPMVGQVPMGYAPGGYHPYNPWSWGSRLRRFFGLAPKNYMYEPDRGMWGFMGYSRKQRYMDPHTGLEVTRNGRRVVRV